jgi:hypothetical protein
MRNDGRRNFLRLATGGLGTLIGALWVNKATACHRRAVCISPASPLYLPAPLEEIPKATTSPVVINFPTPTTGNVQGGGGFYVWGYVTAPTTITGASVIVPSGDPIAGTVATAPTASILLGTGQTPWAFIFNNVPANTGAGTLTLAISYSTNPIPKQVNFQCIA